MAVDMYSERPLFGGAIASTFPVRFQDVSNVRQVPDHQEVFVDPARDESLIFELLELKQDVADNGSAAWFLQDLANEQDAEGTMLVEQSGVVEAPGLSFRTLPAIITTAVGQMVQMFLADAPVTALIDSGSTHNFVNERTAKRLGLRITKCVGLQVAVANGEQIPGSGMCENARITKDGQIFSIRLYVIPLAGFELVLGVNWLRTLGAILWDFTALTMTFTIMGRSITWRGDQVRPHSALRAISAGLPSSSALEHVLTDFLDLFQEPTSLLPARSCDHRITLAHGVDPVAVRPYRYPQAQKDEIEKQCGSMLELGLIRPSRSPYSSPVLLVLKQDKSWRFCIDYRELNAKTVKDKFPIPVIDELLDELHGSRFFTKLDLRSGYHQIRMHPDDVEKTAFRTHHGHFEFLAIAKGRQGREAQNLVKVYLANVRLKEVTTDILITAYEPIVINSLSESASAVGAGVAVPAAQVGCMPMAEVFKLAVSTFKVNDWRLFGAA